MFPGTSFSTVTINDNGRPPGRAIGTLGDFPRLPVVKHPFPTFTPFSHWNICSICYHIPMSTPEEELRRILERVRSLNGAAGPSAWTPLDRGLGPIHWDWPGWLPRGFLTILAGDPGAGKSLLCLHLVAVYLNRHGWPDGAPFGTPAAATGPPATVIWGETESSHALNLQRARDWHLDLERILSPVPNILRNLSLDHPHQVNRLLVLAQREDVRLIIVDSLRGLRSNSKKPASLSYLLTVLTEIARIAGKPIVLTHHLRKSGYRTAAPPSLGHLVGPGVVGQTPRVIWGLDIPDPARPHYRRLSVIKNNLTPFPAPLGFRIAGDGLHFGPPPEPPRPDTERERAYTFLHEQLKGGPLPALTLYERAAAAGLSRRTLRRAKKALGIRSIRPPGETRWHWEFPKKV